MRSTAFITSFILYVAIVFIAQGSGLMSWAKSSFTKAGFVAKVPGVFLQAAKPDVLIIGSSLALVPSVRCDDEMLSGRTRYDSDYYSYIFSYSKSQYLQTLLQKQFGNNVSVLNGAVAATTIADQLLLFKTFLDRGGSCKLAILCISPRELHDNYHPIPEKSLVYEMLGNPFTMSCLRTRGVEGCLSMVWKRIDPLWTNRIAVQRALTPAPLRPKLNKLKPDFTAPKENTLRDIDMWRQTYNPVNWSHYSIQVQALNDLLALAKDRSVPLMIVEMPLPEETVALMKPELKSRYDADITSLAKKYDTTLVTPANEQNYARSDFEDGGHMVASGGRKLFGQIANYIAGNPSLRQQLY